VGREEVYNLEKDKQYLAGTAEVPVTAYFPMKFAKKKICRKSLSHFLRVSAAKPGLMAKTQKVYTAFMSFGKSSK